MTATVLEDTTEFMRGIDSFDWTAPALICEASRDETEADVAVWALVAAFLGIALAIVIYICSVCNARSFNACVNAVRNYWWRGC